MRLGDVGPLRVAAHVGAHGDRRQPVAPPDDALLELVADVGDLRDRHRLAVARRHREVLERRQRRALRRRRRARTTSICLSRSRYVRDREPGQRVVEEGREVLRRDARARAPCSGRWRGGSTLVGSSQSNCTLRRRRVARASPRRPRCAIARTVGRCPRRTRGTAPGSRPAGRSRAARRARAARGSRRRSSVEQPRAHRLALVGCSSAISTNCAKFDCCSCWSSGR